MRTLSRILVAGLLSIGSLLMPSYSLATDAQTAIQLCERNPQCNYEILSEGGVEIKVGDDWISCPEEGDCFCICTHPRSQGLGGRNVVQNLLLNRSAGPTLAQ